MEEESMNWIDELFGGFAAYRWLRGGAWEFVKPLRHESEPWGKWHRFTVTP